MPPKVAGKEKIHPPNKQVQVLENKINNLRWRNDELNKDVFNAVQRGHRLAAKLGYQDLEAAELALATQHGQDSTQSEQQQSQLNQLSQRPSDELASHIQALQSELVSHVHLSRTTLSALGDALTEIASLREENERLMQEVEEAKEDGNGRTRSRWKGEGDIVDKLLLTIEDLGYTRAELTSLKHKYNHLRKAKEEADKKHKQDYEGWKLYKKYQLQLERRLKAKRRKLDFEDNDDDAVMHPEGPAPTVLPSLAETSAVPLSSSDPAVPSKSGGAQPVSSKPVTQWSPGPSLECAASSETEPDSQPVAFIYPSQQDVTEPPYTGQEKRPPSPETECESQDPTFLFGSQIVPLTPAQVSDMTPKMPPVVRRTQQQPMTPVSVARPQQAKENGKASSPTAIGPPASSPLRADVFRRPMRPLGNRAARLPETPVSHGSKKGKGKEGAAENDENAPASASAKPSEKKYPGDYSIYKGRGRYGAEAQAGKDTINALFEIDPDFNEGVGHQYDEVVRDKGRRKHMHAVDCECCRDYYAAIEPLPNRLQPPMWRSPQSSPTKKRKRDSFENEDDGEDHEENDITAIAEHRNAISRHRQHWARTETPPGYWNIGFPDTQEVADMNAEAARMHARKRAMVADEAERGGKYRKR